MSNTPETDHLENSLGPAAEQSHPALWLCARRLERERDEARDCGQEGVCANPPGCHRHWLERNRELVRERDEARKAAQKWRKLYFLQWSIAYDQPLPPDGKSPFPWEESK